MIELDRLIQRVADSRTQEERIRIRLEIISLISELGRLYAAGMQNFSESVIRNKEEWYKKSMTECIHQAGREVGYQHESYKIDIEAAKQLIQATYDMELLLSGGLDDLLHGPDSTDLSSKQEPSSLEEEEGISHFGKKSDKEV